MRWRKGGDREVEVEDGSAKRIWGKKKEMNWGKKNKNEVNMKRRRTRSRHFYAKEANVQDLQILGAVITRLGSQSRGV